MTRARAVWALQCGLGAGALLVLALSVAVAAGAVTFQAPEAQSLMDACRSFGLPHVDAASIASLALGSMAVAVVLAAVRSALRQVRAVHRLVRSLPMTGAHHQGARLFEDTRPLAFV